ncbi:heat shock protein Hsp20 [Candidatus Magnetobacterium bavaricum]|uniref:Heat shock protein Hsp20 n=1 Tax=Candidatus Magnetobacterium bavaricum TaxID=29290 RepID=A0A0F3GPC2_9BACT|nr:heat shock protein Hsp20 [Candidatus Magnetobacterium bavaricum]
MDFKGLVPWGFARKRHKDEDSLLSIHRDISGLLSDFWGGFEVGPFGRQWGGFDPRVNVTEDDTTVKVSAELPGLDEKDIDVSLTRDSLTIKGEKKEETEEKATGYYHVERSYGAFSRTVSLSCDIDHDKVEANFKKGVLVVTLPKTAEACKEKRKITVNT